MSFLRNVTLAGMAAVGASNLPAQNMPANCTDIGSLDKGRLNELSQRYQAYGKRGDVLAKLGPICEEVNARNAKIKAQYAPAAEMLRQMISAIGESNAVPDVTDRESASFRKPLDNTAFREAVKNFIESGAHLLAYGIAPSDEEKLSYQRRAESELSLTLGNNSMPYGPPHIGKRMDLQDEDAVLWLLNHLKAYPIDEADARYRDVMAMGNIIREESAAKQCALPERSRSKKLNPDWLARVCIATGPEASAQR